MPVGRVYERGGIDTGPGGFGSTRRHREIPRMAALQSEDRYLTFLS